MARPTKKARSSNGDHDIAEELFKSEKILRDLSESMGKGEPVDNAKFLKSMLDLKAMQRIVLEKLYETQSEIESQSKVKEQEEMKLENLKYQKTLNEHSINACNQLEMSQLAKLSCDEMDIALPETEKEYEEVVQRWLEANPRDPDNRPNIAAKLNKEVKTRMALETELKSAELKAASLQKTILSKQKLLQELPMKLKEMEGASVPLQKFCQRTLNASMKVGSKRQTSLALARTLPSPLYTLYYQLQSCLDAMASQNKELEKPLPSLDISSDSSKITLKICIPNVSEKPSTTSRMKKFASIFFEYDETWDAITAYSTTDDGMGNLIGELFPDDTGEWIGPESDQKKRSYNWCNYLGGLHATPSNQNAAEIHLSTRVVMKALIRRVRSTATLHMLLQTLSRKPHPIPVHPSLEHLYSSADNPSPARLTNWVEEATQIEKGKKLQNFVAEMKHNSSSISIRVQVNPHRYPSVPPEIKISSTNDDVFHPSFAQTDELGHDSPLYDEHIANLERKVNQDVDELVIPTDDSTYNWILAHQLVEISKTFAKR